MKNIHITTLTALLASASFTHAATITVSAEPYTGYAADSPFASTFGALSLLDRAGSPAETTSVHDFRALTATVATGATYFFLEDLQDGQFDPTGATLTSADHVRTGDGINGSTGTSFADNVFEDSLRKSAIRAFTNSLRVDFTAANLGENLPTHVGVAFVEQSNNRTLTAYRADNTVIHAATFSGATGDDDFVGIISDEGIAYVRAFGSDVEYDHFQYGFVTVPEPSTTALLGLGGLALIFRRRK